MSDITIRAIEVSDWEALYALQQCPKVRRGTLKMPYRSAADTRQRLEKALASESLYRLVAIETSTGRLVGVITLSQLIASRQHVGQLGMAVHDDYQGQGIGSRLLTEVIDIADRWIDLKRLELTVFIDNAPALHLYKKFDFVIEGTLKKYAFRAGNYLDAYTMARIV
jgi:L-phenylalanine/L-methionine N-acetyltransferase